jgi:hypothetical protein
LAGAQLWARWLLQLLLSNGVCVCVSPRAVAAACTTARWHAPVRTSDGTAR